MTFENCLVAWGQGANLTTITIFHAGTATWHSGGNLVLQINTKGDIFMSDPDRTGQIELDHGLGCTGNYSVSASNGQNSQNHFYPGSDTVLAGGKPGFLDDRSVAVSGPDIGNGNYRLSGDSPARSLIKAPLLGLDLDGNPRQAGVQAAGCYV